MLCYRASGTFILQGFEMAKMLYLYYPNERYIA